MTALELVLASAERTPDAIAIEEADGAPVTYAQLIARARGFAARIRDAGIVEVQATRSADFVARCLGAWIAGRAWAPLDPADPPARRETIRTKLAGRLASTTIDPITGRARVITPPLVSEPPAYAISTSGSSGTPKVVLVGHGGIATLIEAQVAAFSLDARARALWLHAPLFDASLSDWGTVLAAGGTLVCPAVVDLAELSRREITHVDLPPVLLEALLARGLPSGLRVVVLGGEACPVDRVRELAARVRVVVVYGPTEATVCSSLVVVDPARWTRPLIGAPLPGLAYRVVDGELWIAGPGLAIGYAGEPVETALRFVERDGVRWYRTGDRVEQTTDGLAFAGRIDRQVKLRGRRVELDEIDHALRLVPGVRAAAVIVRDRHPIAFVEGEVTPTDVLTHLRTALPAWMLPSRIVVGPIARTPTGKVDHTALATQPLPARVPVSFGEPLADAVAALWCEALGTDTVVETDRFRDAGGDSLAAVSLVAAAAARSIALDGALLAGNPTFVEVFAAVRRGLTSGTLSVAECERRGLVAFDRALAATRVIKQEGDDDEPALRPELPPATAHRISQRIALAGLVAEVEPTVRMRAVSTPPEPAASAAAQLARTRAAPPEVPAAADPTARTARTHEPTTRIRRLSATDGIVRGPSEVDGSMPELVPARAPFAAPPATIVDGPHDLVLFTGATGLLGTHLLRAWRALDPRPLAALVRDPDREIEHVELVVGDLAEPWLALTPDAWTALAGRVGAIVHAGAQMSAALDWDAHAATNVSGTAWIARLARESGAPLHHVSTLAVFVGTDRAAGRCGREDSPDPTAIAHGGYAQTKIAAEAIARACGATLYRLGLLVEETPRAGTQLGMIARGLAKLGCVPAGGAGLGFDVTPVEHAADAIAKLAISSAGTHHLAGRRATFAELAGDLPIAADWRARAGERLADPDIAMAYLALARLSGAAVPAYDLFLATGMDFDSPPVPAFALRPRLL